MINTQRTIYENPNMWGKIYHETDIERARLTAAAVPTDVRTILEVGSGDGLIIKALKNAGHHPVAFDISLKALTKIENNDLVQGSGNHLPFCNNAFDLVLACELLEHLPVNIYQLVLGEIARVTKKYLIVTVPFQENLEWSYARCPKCGCIFHGSYHVRSYGENDMKFLFNDFECSTLKGIVNVLHPDRTIEIELFIRHSIGLEYLYCSTSVKCPMCLFPIDKKPKRNLVGWFCSGIRYFFRLVSRKERPLWYLAVYEKAYKGEVLL